MEKQICVLHREGKDETARHYQSTLNAFMLFRGGCELRLDEIDAPLLKEFETYLFSSGVCANTVSFYLRVLRAIHNRAVRDNSGRTQPAAFQQRPYQ
ncbi:MAG: phage integrase SAM-like domain-containing protein [Parabacteroides sp.]